MRKFFNASASVSYTQGMGQSSGESTIRRLLWLVPSSNVPNAQAGAVVGPSKRRQSGLSSGQRASSKTGTINQKAKRPPKSGPPPVENTDTEEEEDEAGPVHSGNYSSESFIDQESDDDESEFNAMLTDGMDEEIHDL